MAEPGSGSSPAQDPAPLYDTGSDAWLRAQVAAQAAAQDALPVQPAQPTQPALPVQPVYSPLPVDPGVPAVPARPVHGAPVTAVQLSPVTRLERRRLAAAELATGRSPARSTVGVLVVLAGVIVILLALLLLRPIPGAARQAGLAGVSRLLGSASTQSAPTRTDPSPDDLTQAELPADDQGAPTGIPGAPPAAPPANAPGSTGLPVTGPTAPLAPLTVLNASRLRGLADRAAADFRAQGWPVTTVANYSGLVASTTVYFPVHQEQVARRLAAQFAGITRVLPRFAGLPGSGLTVVVTRDYQP